MTEAFARNSRELDQMNCAVPPSSKLVVPKVRDEEYSHFDFGTNFVIGNTSRGPRVIEFGLV